MRQKTEAKGRIVRRHIPRMGGKRAQIAARMRGWISPEPRLTLPTFTCESVGRQTLVSRMTNQDSSRPLNEIATAPTLSCTNNDRSVGK
jgi:hypothetical protein